jgi:hypothetical protein
MIISNENTLFFQGINLLIIGIWVLLCLPFYYRDQSMDMFIVLVSGIFFWTIVTFIFFKFHAIKIEDKVEVRNIFSKKRFLKSDLIDIEKTSFSPFIFKLKIKQKSYYFLIDYDRALKAFLSSNSDTIKNDLIRNIK